VLEYFEQQAQERERVAIAEAEATQGGQQPQGDGAAPEETAEQGGEQQADGSTNSTLLSDAIALITKAITQWLAK
jgi:hypothetical protein